MAKKFDPYYQWLRILPSERPPNHYRLLNLQKFESDPEIIDSALEKLDCRLQSFVDGERVAEARSLLGDLEKARTCLGDSKLKAAYDTRLRQKLASASKVDLVTSSKSLKRSQAKPAATNDSPPSKQSLGSTRSSPASAARSRSGIDDKPSPQNSSTESAGSVSRKAKNRKSRNPIQMWIGYGVAMLLATVVGIFVLVQQLKSGRSSDNVAALEKVEPVDNVVDANPAGDVTSNSASAPPDALLLDELKSFEGKKIRVCGVIKKEFGSKKIGVHVQAKDQITVVE